MPVFFFALAALTDEGCSACDRVAQARSSIGGLVPLGVGAAVCYGRSELRSWVGHGAAAHTAEAAKPKPAGVCLG